MKWTPRGRRRRWRCCSTWYPLFDRIAGSSASGGRSARPRDHDRNDCLICSTFFRRLLIDAGEDPGALELDDDDELIVDLGRALADDPHIVDDALRPPRRALRRQQLVLLDRVRRDHGRHERLQRRARRAARRLPAARTGGRMSARRADHRRRPRPGPRDRLALARDGYDIVALDVAAPLAYPGYPMGSPDELGSLAGESPRWRRLPDRRRRRPRRRGGEGRRRRGDRALRPDRRPLQQRRHLRLRARARADRAGVGRDARHQPQGRRGSSPAT